ncbi:MAG TPA: M28 family metallopeptidase [Candidatus Krumholzibacteria bacterium]
MTTCFERAGLGLAALSLAAALHAAPARADDARDRALATITGDAILGDIRELSSDDYQGRMPGTRGEEKTLTYLTGRLKTLRVAPAPGGYLQWVPLIEKTPLPATKLLIGDRRLALGDDIIIKTTGTKDRISVAGSELVFVGYGISAPEIGWNDYAGVDVKGKTVVMLMGDPPGEADSLYFRGRPLTQYGYGLFKAETAARLGARGMITIHDQKVIGYPWSAIAAQVLRPYFERVPDKQSPKMPEIRLTMAHEAAADVMARAGQDLAALEAAAAKKGFTARPLGVSLNGDVALAVKNRPSSNVVAWIKGSERPDEYIVYSAHWDHVGIGAPVNGDSIYNGAVDNASGTACLLALARAYASLPKPPSRSIVFLATTAEEQGLLGAYHYADHPVFPLQRTMANINMDALFPYGPYDAMTIVGMGNSELEDYMSAACAQFGRKLMPDPTPEYGAFFRSDHYPFARKGVPAIFGVGGPLDPAPPGIQAKLDDYLKNKYHRPSDEVQADWDMRGVTDDVKIYFLTGYAIANDARVPNWYFTSEFRAICDRMRASAAP